VLKELESLDNKSEKWYNSSSVGESNGSRS
jgi:hypothetical protein